MSCRNVSLKKNIMNFKVFNLIVLTLFCLSSCSDKVSETDQVDKTEMEIETTQKMKKLRHLVLFKFKETAPPSEIEKVEKAFASLPSKIEQIIDFEWGINISSENLNKGFTHGFLLTFSSEENLDIYLPHPDHSAFVKLIEPVLEEVLVVDYWTN